MTHASIAVLIALTAVASLHAQEPAPAAEPETKQRAEKLDRQVTVTLKADYLLHLPKDYDKDPAKKWPVIIFLHGSGERGTDVNLVKLHGPPKVIEAGWDLPFVVVSPQCPPDKWWDPAVVIALLDEVLDKYRTDPDRVYLTGLSMGGFGTWDTAIAYPDRFAAIAPICGAGNRYRVPAIRHVPTWVFHGDKDQAVPVAASIEMVATLQAVKGNVKFTRYPEAGHDSWTQTYGRRTLYDWFLTHKRGERSEPK